MTAVAPAGMVNGRQDPEKEPNVDQSPSRFTAVNGKESSVAGTNTAIPVPSSSVNSEAHREWHTNWGKGGYDEQSRQDKRPQEGGRVSNDQEDRRSQESPSQYAPSSVSRNKRKRSSSGERQDFYQNSYQGTGISRGSVPRLDDSVDPHALPPSSNSTAACNPGSEPRNTSPAAHPRPETTEGPRTPSTNGPWNDYDSQLINQAQRAQQIDASDAQLAEALQREAQSHDGTPKSWGTVSRPLEGSVQGDQPSPLPAYSQERSAGAVQVAPKRKRVFSNRTKTGCMTCRRRKKKCDEQHPACNNCIRGGFLCEGYSSRGTWQKPSSIKPPVPLQSKDGYADVSSHYIHDMGQYDRQQGLADQLETGKLRPIVVDDSDRGATQYATSPTGVNSGRGSWSKRAWPGAGHSNYAPEHVAKADYREVPPIHEFSRDEPPKTDYQVVPSIRELSQGAHSKPGMPIFQGTVDQRPPVHTSNVDTSSPQAQARMALSIEHQLSARTVSGEETEKEKMLRGELYRPFDIHLVEERERCKAALWRFNNSCNAISGLSAKEQNRLLKEILVPPPNWNANSPSITTAPRSTGSIGQGAVVEAPFRCHYGYNIHISEDVMISESCLFVDDCNISIGAHTWIGPKVTILSSMAHANMQERKGTQSRYQGRPVTIEEDCYVGAGCTIYPGVRLRRGAYVAPGEVVKTDIVAYGFQGLKPSYM